MLNEQGKAFSSSSLLGKPWILNVWASWCESCRDEHAALIEFAKQTNSMIVGMDYKDDDAQAINMISHLGNPYKTIVTDKDGMAGVEFGVYGVPETYVIDRTGIIRYKKTGTLTEQDIYHDVLPLLRE
jgi:cytochrome c biogenesis protein CcmG/thiol:disulfide interchange protein DsbE